MARKRLLRGCSGNRTKRVARNLERARNNHMNKHAGCVQIHLREAAIGMVDPPLDN